MKSYALAPKKTVFRKKYTYQIIFSHVFLVPIEPPRHSCIRSLRKNAALLQNHNVIFPAIYMSLCHHAYATFHYGGYNNSSFFILHSSF